MLSSQINRNQGTAQIDPKNLYYFNKRRDRKQVIILSLLYMQLFYINVQLLQEAVVKKEDYAEYSSTKKYFIIK